ncbi:MAG: cyclic nucleotide-binding domain-containing protein [Pseudomonadota bacterium]
MDLMCWAATDNGRQRDHNEDNFLLDRDLQVFMVADGMGGHAAGEIASLMAVQEIRNHLRANSALLQGFEHGDPAVSPKQILEIIEQGFQQACALICRRAQAEPEKRGMGTTCSLLLIAGSPSASSAPRAFIGHVGDSRIYLVRGNETHQITVDHSLINELIRHGKVRREEIDSSPYRQYKNAVTRAVGVYESVEAETFYCDVLPGDSFLLCSDGLHSYFSNEELASILSGEKVEHIPQKLIDKSNERGGHDNITAVCVRIPAKETAADARTEELALTLEVLKAMPLFRHLSYRELVRVMNTAAIRQFSRGERIFLEGDQGLEMFVILRGTVRLDKRDTFIASLGKGSHFGEMALVDQDRRSLAATAEEPSLLLSISRKSFYEMVRKEPELSVKLLWSFVQVLAERLRKTTADLSGARMAEYAEDMSDQVLFDES